MRPTSDTPWLSALAAQRLTGLTRYTFENLQRTGAIRHSDQGGIHTEDLAMIQNWQRHTYVTGKANVDLDQPYGFAVPLTDPGLSPDLNLSANNDAALARAGAEQQGIELDGDQILSGWWSCQQGMAEQLVARRAPLLGVTGKFVVAGAWIDAIAKAHPESLRKAFVATRMTPSELETFRGYVPGINQSGVYCQLP